MYPLSSPLPSTGTERRRGGKKHTQKKRYTFTGTSKQTKTQRASENRRNKVQRQQQRKMSGDKTRFNGHYIDTLNSTFCKGLKYPKYS